MIFREIYSTARKRRPFGVGGTGACRRRRCTKQYRLYRSSLLQRCGRLRLRVAVAVLWSRKLTVTKRSHIAHVWRSGVFMGDRQTASGRSAAGYCCIYNTILCIRVRATRPGSVPRRYYIHMVLYCMYNTITYTIPTTADTFLTSRCPRRNNLR